MSFNDLLIKMDDELKNNKHSIEPIIIIPTKEEAMISLSSLFIKFYKYLKYLFNI